MSTLPSTPPLDQGFLDAVQAQGLDPIEPRWGQLLSPPESAWGRWSGAAASWGSDRQIGQVVFALAHPPASCVQDPWGRALSARTHAAALASWSLLDLVEQTGLSTSQAEVLGLVLAIQGRCPHTPTWALTDESLADGELPRAHPRFVAAVPKLVEGEPDPLADDEALPVPEPGTEALLRELFVGLAGIADAWDRVPETPLDHGEELPDTDGEDPLGLDAILAEHTAPASVDPSGVWLDSAEMLGRLAIELRLRLAGIAEVVCRALQEQHGRCGAGIAARALEALDVGIDEVLAHLVEIRAVARSGEHSLTDVGRALHGTAERINEVRSRTVGVLVAQAQAVLPPGSTLEAPSGWADSDLVFPEYLLEDLQASPPGLERDVEIVLVEALLGRAAGVDLERVAVDAQTGGRTPLAGALFSLAAVVYLHQGVHEDASRCAVTAGELATSEHNAVGLVQATWVAADAAWLVGDRDRCAELRHRGGVALGRLCASGCLARLARWSPPILQVDPPLRV